uniref:Uncharacterized protein n=1 Tax=Romanomermis culicivorax TaxID=13658 RepID=A0A915KD60_ROMCU
MKKNLKVLGSNRIFPSKTLGEKNNGDFRKRNFKSAANKSIFMQSANESHKCAKVLNRRVRDAPSRPFECYPANRPQNIRRKTCFSFFTHSAQKTHCNDGNGGEQRRSSGAGDCGGGSCDRTSSGTYWRKILFSYNRSETLRSNLKICCFNVSTSDRTAFNKCDLTSSTTWAIFVSNSPLTRPSCVCCCCWGGDGGGVANDDGKDDDAVAVGVFRPAASNASS